jgi:hypothetical protein
VIGFYLSSEGWLSSFIFYVFFFPLTSLDWVGVDLPSIDMIIAINSPIWAAVVSTLGFVASRIRGDLPVRRRQAARTASSE